MGERKIWKKFKLVSKEKKPKITYESRWTKKSYKSDHITIFNLFNLEKFMERSHLATITGFTIIFLAAFIVLVTNIKLECTFSAIIITFAVMLKLYGMSSKEFIYNFIPGILFGGWLLILLWYLFHEQGKETLYIFFTGIITLFTSYTFFYSMR